LAPAALYGQMSMVVVPSDRRSPEPTVGEGFRTFRTPPNTRQAQQQARPGAHRLGQFGYLKPFGGALPGYWVRTHIASLSERQLTRGGRRVRQLHEQFMAAKTPR
jgi:hypothetical protein